MFRKLLIIASLVSIVFIAFGQNRRKDKSLLADDSKNTAAIDYKQPGAPLPALKLYRKDGKYINNDTLKNDATLVMMLFNPTCEHCEEQAILFRKNIFLFQKTNLVLVAGSAMLPYLEYFVNTTKIADYPSIQLTVDSSNYIEKTYFYGNLPQINIYGKDRKLIKTFQGETPLDSLRQYIE